MARSYRFPRSQRLKRQRLIRPLFDREREDVETLAAGCIRLLFRMVPVEAVGAEVPLQVGFASGRARTAVRRNRIRRLLREVYRRHQHLLLKPLSGREQVLTLMILFRGPTDRADDCIPQDLPVLLHQLAERLNSSAASSVHSG